MRLIKNFAGYFYKPFDRIKCSDVSVAKYVVPNWVKKDEVFVIFSNLADGGFVKYYFHPKYRKWYKNLTEKDIEKYFPWL